MKGGMGFRNRHRKYSEKDKYKTETLKSGS